MPVCHHWGMCPQRIVDVPLTERERRVLLGGIAEWGGPAHCTEEFAIAMGFRSLADLFETSERLWKSLKDCELLTAVDWVRVDNDRNSVRSDVVGSGWDWQSTVGLTDGETIALVRSIQTRSRRRGSSAWCSEHADLMRLLFVGWEPACRR